MTANVSVVVPCYNASRFLAATLDSALAQSRTPLEIIVVDDGSTDDSLAIAQRHRQRAGVPIVVETGPNRGVSVARNRGLALARGDCVQFLDADDLLRPHALATRVDALAASGDDVAYSDWQELNETDAGTFVPGRIHDRDWLSYAADAELAVLRGFWVPPAAVLYRRALVERIGGFDVRSRERPAAPRPRRRRGLSAIAPEHQRVAPRPAGIRTLPGGVHVRCRGAVAQRRSARCRTDRRAGAKARLLRPRPPSVRSPGLRRGLPPHPAAQPSLHPASAAGHAPRCATRRLSTQRRHRHAGTARIAAAAAP